MLDTNLYDRVLTMSRPNTATAIAVATSMNRALSCPLQPASQSSPAPSLTGAPSSTQISFSVGLLVVAALLCVLIGDASHPTGELQITLLINLGLIYLLALVIAKDLWLDLLPVLHVNAEFIGIYLMVTGSSALGTLVLYMLYGVHGFWVVALVVIYALYDRYRTNVRTISNDIALIPAFKPYHPEPRYIPGAIFGAETSIRRG